jgi:hypothetical protein
VTGRAAAVLSAAILLALAPFVAGADYVPKPLPKHAPTTRDFRPRYLAWLESTVVDHVRAAHADATWHDQAVAFSVDWAHWQVRDPLSPTAERYRAELDDLVKAGCDDAFILFERGQSLRKQDRHAEARTVLLGLQPRMAELPAMCRAWALHDLGTYCGMPNRAGLDGKALRTAQAVALADMLLEPGDREVVERQFVAVTAFCATERNSPTLGLPTFDQLRDELERRGDAVSAWAREMVVGMDEFDRSQRGPHLGWGPDGPDQGDPAEHLRLARAALTRAWQAEPGRPESSIRMIKIAAKDQGDPERLWFDRAVAAEVDAIDAWSALRTALADNHDNSVEALESLGREALAYNRFDSEVTFQYLTCLQSADYVLRESHDDAARAKFWNWPSRWSECQEVIDGYLAAPGLPNREWMLSWKAALAWRCGIEDEARALVRELGDKVERRPFSWLAVPVDDLMPAGQSTKPIDEQR